MPLFVVLYKLPTNIKLIYYSLGEIRLIDLVVIVDWIPPSYVTLLINLFDSSANSRTASCLHFGDTTHGESGGSPIPPIVYDFLTNHFQ